MGWFNTGLLLPILMLIGGNALHNYSFLIERNSTEHPIPHHNGELNNNMIPSCRIWDDIDFSTTTTSSVVYDSCDVGSATTTDAASFNPVSNDVYHMVYSDICGDGEIIARVNATPTNSGYSGIEIREHTGAGSRKLLLLTNFSTTYRTMSRSIENGIPTSSLFFKPTTAIWVKITRSGDWLNAYGSNNGITWTFINGAYLSGLSNCLIAGVSAQTLGFGSTSVDYHDIDITDAGLPITEVNFSNDTINANAGDTVQVCLDITNGCGSCVPTSANVALTTSAIPHLTSYSTETVTFDDGSITKCFDLAIGNQSGDGVYTLGLQNITGGNNAQSGSIAALTLNVTGTTTLPTEVTFNQSNDAAEPGTTIDICVDLVNPCGTCVDPAVDVVLQGDGSPHLTVDSITTLTFNNGSLQECFSLTIGPDNSIADYTFNLSNATGGNSIQIGSPSTMDIHVAPFTTVSFNVPNMNEEPGTTVDICVDLANPCGTCADPTVDVVLQGDGSPHLTVDSVTTLSFSGGALQQCIPLTIGPDNSVADYTFNLSNATGGNNIQIDMPSTMNLNVSSFTTVSFNVSSMDEEPGTTVDVCVDLVNPCGTCADPTVDVVLQGDGSPHLTVDSVTTLTFSNGSLQECFPLTIGADNSVADYTFNLSNATGGNNIQVGSPSTMDLHVALSTTMSFNVSSMSEEPGTTANICVDLASACASCLAPTIDVVLQGNGSPYLAVDSVTTLTFNNGSLQECFPVIIASGSTMANYTFNLSNATGGNNTQIVPPSSLSFQVAPITEMSFDVSSINEEPGGMVDICVDLVNRCTNCFNPSVDVVLQGDGSPHLTVDSITTLAFNGSSQQECFSIAIGPDNTVADYTFSLSNAFGQNTTQIVSPSDMVLHVIPQTLVSFDVSNMDEEPGTTVDVCVDLVNPCASCADPTVDVILQGDGTPHLTVDSITTLTFSNGSLQECFPVVIGADNSVANYTFNLNNATGGNDIQIISPSDMLLKVAPYTTVSFDVSSMDEEPGTTVNVCVDLTNPCTGCSDPTVDVALQGDGSPHLTVDSITTLTFSNGSLQECFPLVIETDLSIADYTFLLQNAAGGNNIQIGLPSNLNLHVENVSTPSCRIWNETDFNVANSSSIVFDSCDVGFANISDNTNYNPVANDQYHLVYTDICGEGLGIDVVEVVAKINAVPSNSGYAGIEIREHAGSDAQKLLLLTNYTNEVRTVYRKNGLGYSTNTYTVGIIPQWVKIARIGVWLYAYVSENGSTWNLVYQIPFQSGLPNCLIAGLSAQGDGTNYSVANFSEAAITDEGLPATEINFSDDELFVDAGSTIQVCLDITNGCGACVSSSADVVLNSPSGSPHFSSYTTATVPFDDQNTTQCFDLIVGNDLNNGTYTFELQNVIGGNNAQAGNTSTLTINVIGSTKLKFETANISTSPGTTVDVCVDLIDPCVSCNDVATIEVALQGTDSPHLSGFTTKTLTFNNGSTQECFTQTISNDEVGADYTLLLQNATGGNNITTITPNSTVINVIPNTVLDLETITIDTIPGVSIDVCATITNPCATCSDVEADLVLTSSGAPHLTTYITQPIVFDNGSTYECVTVNIGNDPSMADYTLQLQNIAGGNNTNSTNSSVSLHVQPPPPSLSFSSSTFNGIPGGMADLCVDLINPCTNCGDVTLEVALITSNAPHLTTYMTDMLTFSNGSVSECLSVSIGNDPSSMDYTFELQNVVGNNAPSITNNTTTVLSISTPTELSFSESFIQTTPGETVTVYVNLTNPCATCDVVTVEVALQGDGTPHLTTYMTEELTFNNGSTQESFPITIGTQQMAGTYTFSFQNASGGNNLQFVSPSEFTLYVQYISADDLLGCVWFPDLIHCESNTNPDGSPPLPGEYVACNFNDPANLIVNPWFCDPNDKYKGIPNVEIAITNLSDLSTTNVISDGSGFFGSDMTSGMIQMVPAPFDPYLSGATDWMQAVNGINTLDISNVTKYINDMGDLCPLSRIAADVDCNGRVDLLDVAKMNDVLLMNDLTFDYPNWRFVPLPYVYPNDGHNDPAFLADFWQSLRNDHRGLEYPFNAILNFNGKSYTYLGDENGENSWMDKLIEWPYSTPEAECGEAKWGFYAIKLGETTANAYVNAPSSSPLSGTDFMELIEEEIDSGIPSNRSPVLNFLIRVNAQTLEPIPVASYQIGLKLDSTLLDLIEIVPRVDTLNQELERNFGISPLEWEKGNIRATWINDFEDNEQGLLLDEGMMLFEFIVSVDTSNLPNPGEVAQAIAMKREVLPTAFFSLDRQIEDVEITFEILGL